VACAIAVAQGRPISRRRRNTMAQLLQANVPTGTDVSSRGWLANRHRWPLIAACIAVLACAHDLSAQVSYAVVADLSTIGGAAPLGGVIRGADGALYGTTSEGGAENCGIVYRIDPAGALSRIHEFSRPDGCQPVGELALGPDGSLYGVASRGGLSNQFVPSGAGTIYKIAANGAFTVLHQFVFPLDLPPEPWLVPYEPYAGLTLAPDGHFYGTLRSGDVFRISLDGAFALVHQFSAEAEPQDLEAALIVAADGYLYSTSPNVLTTRLGAGALFRVSLDGAAEVLHRFIDYGHVPPGVAATPEGAYPYGELAAGPDGEFYGANSSGGPNVRDRGTIFRLAPDRTLTVLHAFSEGTNQSYPDGAFPWGGLILGTDGYLYGTTSAGGANGIGTIFRIGRDGAFMTLRAFAQDGFTQTKGRLLEASPGVFYGTAHSASGGIVYRLSVSSASLAISLVAPLGGETLFVDVPTTIQWAATVATTVDVELSDDGGRSFTAIPGCSGLPGSSTSCAWTPTGPPTPKAQIRVVAHDAVGGSASDVTGNIRISAASPRVKIVWPHPAARLTIGTTETLRWIHNLGTNSVVRIESSRDGGSTWEVIAPAVRNATAHFGAFNWLVTGPATTTAILRVTSLSTGAFDVSNRPFRVLMPTSLESSSR